MEVNKSIEWFDGLIPSIEKMHNIVSYNPASVNLKDMVATFFNHKPITPEYKLHVSMDCMIYMSGDKEKIAALEKRRRIERISSLRGWILKYGNELARTFLFLGKPGTYWNRSQYGEYSYKGIGKGEFDDVSINIKMQDGLFDIYISANDAYGYCPDIYYDLIAKGVSPKSVIPIVKYLEHKLKNNGVWTK